MTKRGFQFTARDSDLLVDLYKHRYLRIGQVQRLYFPSLQTTYRRTHLLRQQGYVAAFAVAHINEAVLSLAPKGVAVVAQVLGVERQALVGVPPATKPRDAYFLRHFLAINDFRIALREACQRGQVSLRGFIPDYYGERTSTGGVRKYIRDVVCDLSADRQPVNHTPDGVFALERDGRTALFFLEIDRGTEVVSDPTRGVLKALRFYANLLLDGKYQRYAEDFRVTAFKGFRVLIVTTTEERLANMRCAAAALTVPEKAKRFLWLTTFAQVDTLGLQELIWVSSAAGDTAHYSLMGRAPASTD